MVVNLLVQIFLINWDLNRSAKSKGIRSLIVIVPTHSHSSRKWCCKTPVNGSVERSYNAESSVNGASQSLKVC